MDRLQRSLKSKEIEAFKATRDRGHARLREMRLRAEHDRMVKAYSLGLPGTKRLGWQHSGSVDIYHSDWQ